MATQPVTMLSSWHFGIEDSMLEHQLQSKVLAVVVGMLFTTLVQGSSRHETQFGQTGQNCPKARPMWPSHKSTKAFQSRKLARLTTFIVQLGLLPSFTCINYPCRSIPSMAVAAMNPEALHLSVSFICPMSKLVNL